jgi:hypothetical protein
MMYNQPYVVDQGHDVVNRDYRQDEQNSLIFNQEYIRNKVRTEFYPFLNDQLKELVMQIEMYI